MRTLKIDNMPEQGTFDWQRLRLGNFTGSQISKLMTSGRKKDEVFGEVAKKYLYRIASERMLSEKMVNDDELFGLYLDQTTSYSKHMQWGHDQESDARELYEKKTGNKVTEVSSIMHETIDYYAASPDGVIFDKEGCLEIKSPLPETFINYKANITNNASMKKTMPDYYWQMMAEMDCTGAKWTDFVVYCPFLGDPIHIVRINRDDDEINLIHERIALAEEFIDKKIFKNDTDNEETIPSRPEADNQATAGNAGKGCTKKK